MQCTFRNRISKCISSQHHSASTRLRLAAVMLVAQCIVGGWRRCPSVVSLSQYRAGPGVFGRRTPRGLTARASLDATNDGADDDAPIELPGESSFSAAARLERMYESHKTKEEAEAEALRLAALKVEIQWSVQGASHARDCACPSRNSVLTRSWLCAFRSRGHVQQRRGDADRLRNCVGTGVRAARGGGEEVCGQHFALASWALSSWAHGD